MNTNIQVKTQNKYNIKVIRDGVIREEYDFGNTLCKGILSGKDILYKLLVGKGTGTPSWDDTDMFSRLWAVELSTLSEETQPDGSYKATAQVTIPASSSYVGTVTEIGLYTRYSKLTTHALVTDAEGNPISIDKTDLDILIITIDFIVMVDIGDAQKQANGEKDISHVVYITLKEGNLHHYLRIFEVLYGCNLNVAVNSTTSCANLSDENARTLKNAIKTKRLGVGDNNGHYFKAIGIAPDCIYDMKDIFTPYTVQGAAIGTGDGATPVFACPLSYFKENTEKIYKNGTLLTRGVDYTLDNINNSGSAIFYPHSIKTVVSGGDTVNAIGSSYSNLKPYLQSFMTSYSVDAEDKLPLGFGISKDHPLFIDYGEAVRINTMVLGEPRGGSPKITLSYSTDGAAYTPVPEVTAVSWSGAMTKTFSTITARYWRLENDSASVIAQSSGASYLIHKTDGITFTQAPANGDVLTMDATLDYPFKNDKHVIDINWDCTLTFA